MNSSPFSDETKLKTKIAERSSYCSNLYTTLGGLLMASILIDSQGGVIYIYQTGIRVP